MGMFHAEQNSTQFVSGMLYTTLKQKVLKQDSIVNLVISIYINSFLFFKFQWPNTRKMI